MISILWLIFCIPIITIGTATSAAYYTMIKVVRKKTGYITKEFFTSFKQNALQGIIFNLLLLVCGMILFLNISYLQNKTEQFYIILLIGSWFIIFLILGLCFYLFPNLSRFSMSKMKLIKLSLYMEFRYLHGTILGFLVLLISILTIYMNPWSIFFVPGIVFYIFTIIIEPIIQKIMIVPEEGSAEAQKWYYK